MTGNATPRLHYWRRTKCGLSFAKFAGAIRKHTNTHIPISRLARIEHGAEPRLDTARAIVDTLGVLLGTTLSLDAVFPRGSHD